MSRYPTHTNLASFIEKNLWAVLVALFAAYQTFVGQGARIEKLENEMAHHKQENNENYANINRKLSARFTYNQDVAAIVNHLCAKEKECKSMYDTLRTPE